MTSPLIRAWFAARLVDWADHGYAIWRGTLHALGISTEWDVLELDAEYVALAARIRGHALDLPGLDGNRQPIPGPEDLRPQAGELHFHTLMPCPVCHVSVGKDCVTRFGNVTGPHRARRDAAARQTAAETAS